MKKYIIRNSIFIALLISHIPMKSQDTRQAYGYSDNVKSVKTYIKYTPHSSRIGQDSLSLEEMYTSFPIYNAITTEFDKNGKIVNREIYSIDENMQGHEEFLYDNKNRIIETRYFDKNNNFIKEFSSFNIYDETKYDPRNINLDSLKQLCYNIYHYDYQGNLLDWYAGNTLQTSINITYDDNEFKILEEYKVLTHSESKKKSSFQYNDKNKLISETRYSNYGDRHIIKYEYNTNGDISKLSNDKKRKDDEYYYYDEMNRLIKIVIDNETYLTKYNLDGTIFEEEEIYECKYYPHHYKTKYTYDKYGNCLSVEMYNYSLKTSCRTYEYTYFE